MYLSEFKIEFQVKSIERDAIPILGFSGLLLKNNLFIQ